MAAVTQRYCFKQAVCTKANKTLCARTRQAQQTLHAQGVSTPLETALAIPASPPFVKAVSEEALGPSSPQQPTRKFLRNPGWEGLTLT